MSFFGLNFGQNADIDIILDDQESRKMADIRDENGRKERLYLFYDGESVSGKVNVTLHRKTNRLEHHGIKIEFIGQIELYYDRGNHHEFLSLVKELARPGELTQNTAFDFEFNQVEKPYECYTGANVRLRYFLRVTIVRRLTDMVKEMDLLVHTLATYPDMNNPIKMEVGIEECLHIEFEYNKSKYHLKDVIVGKIYFLLVRIKIKHMEVAIIKRETTGSGPNTFHDNETIAKYEIMDGAPVKGESIPIRVFLAGYDLTPTMRDINKKFSVRYFLNLVLVDEEERRYFKQQEITLWRKAERPRKAYSLSGGPGGVATSSSGPLPLHHAMARHQGGDFPSQNIRTAPTPSNPNTPIVGDHPVYGHMSGSGFVGQGDVGRQFSVETEDMNSSGNNSERDADVSAGNVPQQMVCEDDENNSEPEIVSHADVPSPEVGNTLSDDLQHKARLSETKTEAEKVVKRNEVAAPLPTPAAATTTQQSTTQLEVTKASTESEVVSAAAAVATAAAAAQAAKATKSPTSDDEDDKPRPPEDDSVPDEDSLIQTAAGEEDDDDDIIGNDDL